MFEDYLESIWHCTHMHNWKNGNFCSYCNIYDQNVTNDTINDKYIACFTYGNDINDSAHQIDLICLTFLGDMVSRKGVASLPVHLETTTLMVEKTWSSRQRGVYRVQKTQSPLLSSAHSRVTPAIKMTIRTSGSALYQCQMRSTLSVIVISIPMEPEASHID